MKMVRPRFSRFILLTFLLALVLVVPAFAQDATPPAIPDDEVNAIAKQMFCPVCENVPLDVCPTQACAQWRELIRQRLSEGWSEQQIKDYFVQQYGDRVLAEPPRTGLNWLVYIIPPIIVLVGMVIVVRVLQSWKVQTAKAPSGALPTIDDDYVRRLEDELKRRN
ncbi:MAG TPA: cytochrome c-type biogenesis protein CcmH [Anaerolineales bacterium]|nr:cytochrome c-type biogenesis protein CcmH [Anaerolineales bacterium]